MMTMNKEGKYRESDYTKIGFWRHKKEHTGNVTLPFPEAHTQIYSAKFMKFLILVEAESRSEAYRGYSACRICDKNNGSYTYYYKGFQWPQGLKHYMQEHQVAVPMEFIKMVTHYGQLIRSRNSLSNLIRE